MHSAVRTRRNRLRLMTCRAALLLVASGLLLQSLAPPGYMAGSLADGWPVVLCPEGLPAGYLGHGHHQHDEAGAGGHDLSLDGHCPLGSVLDGSVATVLPANEQHSTLIGLEVASGRSIPIARRPLRAHPTRAPPAAG